MQGPYAYDKDEDKSKTVESSSVLPEIKMEIVDESVESEEICNDGKDKVNLASETHNKNYEIIMKDMCPYCWKEFDENCNMRDHMIAHSNEQSYECAICGLHLKTKTLLESHLSLHKSDMNMFHCADCDFKSEKASSIKCHKIKCHATSIYKCQFCSELFQDKAVFLRHMKFHAVVSACDKRDHTRGNNSHFTQHKCQDDKNIHNQHENECQNDKKHAIIKECEPENFDLQEYNNKSLNRLNRDLSLRKKKIFKCSQCRWTFRTINLLNKHTKRHSRNFKCHECDAVFKYKASFLKHKYRHKNIY